MRPEFNCFISTNISVDTLCGFAPLAILMGGGGGGGRNKFPTYRMGEGRKKMCTSRSLMNVHFGTTRTGRPGGYPNDDLRN